MKMVGVNGVLHTTEEAHRLMWNWLADNPKSCKFDYFANFTTGEIPKAECYACEEMKFQNKKCHNCPINWNKENSKSQINSCLKNNSLYQEWDNSDDLEKRSAYARQIAEMQWKEGGWYE